MLDKILHSLLNSKSNAIILHQVAVVDIQSDIIIMVTSIISVALVKAHAVFQLYEFLLVANVVETNFRKSFDQAVELYIAEHPDFSFKNSLAMAHMVVRI